jgi:hypothetical protein
MRADISASTGQFFESLTEMTKAYKSGIKAFEKKGDQS